MYCETCHERLKTGTRKCPNCGHAVKGGRDLGSASLRDTSNSSSVSLPPAPTLVGAKPAAAAAKAAPATKPAASASPASPTTPSAAPAPPAAPEATPAAPAPPAAPTSEPPAAARPAKPPAARPASSVPSAAIPSFDLSPDGIRNLVIAHPELIEEGLSVHQDGSVSGGRFQTSVGCIDLLARDSAAGWVVVVVAESGKGKEIVSDLLQLMGWVKKHLRADAEEVRGIVLVESVPDDLGYAAAAVADTVEFVRYRVGLTLDKIDV